MIVRFSIVAVGDDGHWQPGLRLYRCRASRLQLHPRRRELTMASKNNTLDLSDAEIASSFSSGPWADQFPPILDVALAAKLALVPVGTIYEWSSRGLLASCATRAGKY